MVYSSVQGWGSRASIWEKCWISLVVRYEASVRENCSVRELVGGYGFIGEEMEGMLDIGMGRGEVEEREEGVLRPRQILGPPLKGRNACIC